MFRVGSDEQLTIGEDEHFDFQQRLWLDEPRSDPSNPHLEDIQGNAATQHIVVCMLPGERKRRVRCGLVLQRSARGLDDILVCKDGRARARRRIKLARVDLEDVVVVRLDDRDVHSQNTLGKGLAWARGVYRQVR